MTDTNGEVALDCVGKVNYHHGEVLRSGDEMLVQAIAAGDALLRLKEIIPHGDFGGYVKENLIPSVRMVQYYMKASKDLGRLPKYERRSYLEASAGVKSLSNAVAKMINPPEEDPPAPSPPPPSEPCTAAEPPESKETLEDADEPCANCGGIEWVQSNGSTDFDECSACGHPHGEPAGDLDEGDEGWKIQKKKTLKTIQAAVRAVDDLHKLKRHPSQQKLAIICLQDAERHVEEW